MAINIFHDPHKFYASDLGDLNNLSNDIMNHDYCLYDESYVDYVNFTYYLAPIPAILHPRQTYRIRDKFTSSIYYKPDTQNT